MKQLQHAIELGATMYIPATHEQLWEVTEGHKFPALKSVAVCLEDAVLEKDVQTAMVNLKHLLQRRADAPRALLPMLRPLALALACLPVGLPLGLGLALAARSKKPWLRSFATLFSTVFRGLPELLTLLIIYYGCQIAARRSARFIFSPHAKAMISRKKFQSWCPQYGQGFFGIGKLNHAYLLVLRKFCTGTHCGQKLAQRHAPHSD